MEKSISQTPPCKRISLPEKGEDARETVYSVNHEQLVNLDSFLESGFFINLIKKSREFYTSSNRVSVKGQIMWG